MRLLALDTATELCSAAVWLDGTLIEREATRQQGHSESILPMIADVLGVAGIELAQLDAIAFGRGPGAFTGVRLAVGVAQGLAFAARLPLLPVSDLRALAAQALAHSGGGGAGALALVCQDARMNEVYWGCFERHADDVRAHGPEAVGAPGAVTLPPGWEAARVRGVGSGFDAYASQLAGIAGGLQVVWAGMRPRAAQIARLAAQDGLARAIPPEQAQPVYLRDHVARPPASL